MRSLSLAAFALIGCTSEKSNTALADVGEPVRHEYMQHGERDLYAIPGNSILANHLHNMFSDMGTSFDKLTGSATADAATEWNYLLIPHDGGYDVRRVPIVEGIGGASSPGGTVQNGPSVPTDGVKSQVKYGALDLDTGGLTFYTLDELMHEIGQDHNSPGYGLLLVPDKEGHYQLPPFLFPKHKSTSSSGTLSATLYP